MNDSLDLANDLLAGGGLEISMSSILAGVIFGLIGYWVYRQGKRNSNMKVLMVGLVLMVYPYFTPGPAWDWSLGFGLCGLAYYLW